MSDLECYFSFSTLKLLECLLLLKQGEFVLQIAISNTTLSVQNFKAAMAVPSALGLDPTVANSGDKIKFLLIKAPLEDSYDLARAAFKVAEDFEVSIKLVNDVSSTLEKSQSDITTKYDYN
ncbi:hypothetical protein Q3G72_017051 [Acer saccharum]|nr:hypothetical protein Q3G72_017051 [Acer saccharum]